MAEPIFNLFVFIHNDHVVALGAGVHEIEADDETCLAFLLSMVPQDALTSSRYTFPPSEAMETLPCGTLGLPVHHYEFTRASGHVLSLFEPILKRYNAPETPLFCLTTVQNGTPMNELGPIYEGGSKESDRKLRHKITLSKLLEQKSVMLLSTARQNGRGVFVLLPDPHVLAPENRQLKYLKEKDCVRSSSTWDKLATFVSAYDPETEGVFLFQDIDGESLYRVGIPRDSDST
jgi:hypothetical protein